MKAGTPTEPERAPESLLEPPGAVIRRHGWVTRIWHWVNAVAVLILLGSGLGISNAHPRLYWGVTARISITPGPACRTFRPG
ncbi:hypothetical protein GCM10020258_14350 [Sphingomonas yabuuchiae]